MVFRWTSPPCSCFSILCKAYKCLQSVSKRACYTFTITVLRQIYSKLQPFHSQDVDSSMLLAAFTLAFFRFLLMPLRRQELLPSAHILHGLQKRSPLKRGRGGHLSGAGGQLACLVIIVALFFSVML